MDAAEVEAAAGAAAAASAVVAAAGLERFGSSFAEDSRVEIEAAGWGGCCSGSGAERTV